MNVQFYETTFDGDPVVSAWWDIPPEFGYSVDICGNGPTRDSALEDLHEKTREQPELCYLLEDITPQDIAETTPPRIGWEL
jgi:hypothetical protein